MSKKMIRRSAELLNDVARFEYRMRVQLFQQENEIPYDPYAVWNVGEPLYPHPLLWKRDSDQWVMRHSGPGPEQDYLLGLIGRIPEWVDYTAYSGNEVWPMLESYDGDQDELDEEHCWNDEFSIWLTDRGNPPPEWELHSSDVEMYFNYDCYKCEVSWVGDEPCFVCGGPKYGVYKTGEPVEPW